MSIDQHLLDYEADGTRVADLTKDEAELLDQRDERIREIVTSLVGNPNPLTGKPHSATSAEAESRADERVRALEVELIAVRHMRALVEVSRNVSAWRVQAALVPV